MSMSADAGADADAVADASADESADASTNTEGALHVQLKELEQQCADAVLKKRRIERQISALARKRRAVKERARIDADGFYRFSDIGCEHAMALDCVWTENGDVAGGVARGTAEQRARGCGHVGCRFKLAGVAPARHTPLYELAMDAERTCVLILCEYCRPRAYELLQTTDYWQTNHDEGSDGYGGYTPKDYYAKPFLAVPVAQVARASERDVATLLHWAVRPRA